MTSRKWAEKACAVTDAIGATMMIAEAGIVCDDALPAGSPIEVRVKPDVFLEMRHLSDEMEFEVKRRMEHGARERN